MKNEILNSKLWISFLLYSLIPILPLLIKLSIDRTFELETITISAAMYIIGAAISSENFLLFVLYLCLSIVILLAYGEMQPNPNPINKKLLYFVCLSGIVITMVISFYNYYKFYVMGCRPLEIKFAKDLIKLTSNSDKQDNA